MSSSKVEKKCPLCGTAGVLFSEANGKKYYNCSLCKSIFMAKEHYLTAQEEKERYKEHNNDVDDPRYQNFVAPLVKAVQSDFGPDDIGLDFGCGTGPVISKLLKDDGYEVNLYDPYFANYPENLKLKYDYIVCCEVMEHFYYPYKEFHRLHSLLKVEGAIFFKTSIYSDDFDFDTWFYKDDPTHVFFYQEKTLKWIKEYFQFSDLIIEEEYIKFKL